MLYEGLSFTVSRVNKYFEPEWIMISRPVTTLITTIRFLPRVLPNMKQKIPFPGSFIPTDLTDIRLQLRVHCLHMLLQTFTVRAHFLADLTPLGCSPVGELNHGLSEMSDRVVGELNLLVEPLVADITLVQFQIGVGLTMLLQGVDSAGLVGHTLDTLIHITILLMLTPQMLEEIRPPQYFKL